MSLVLVLDGRAKSRQVTTGLVRDAGHRAISVADAALAADLVLEHASELRLIAANADDPTTAALQRWLTEAPVRPRPALLLYDPSAPAETLQLTLGALPARRSGLERELANTLRALQTAEAEREQLMVRLVAAEEAERERIAADIHDDSLQVMASAVLRLGMLARELPEASHQDSVHRVTLSIEAAIGRLRRLVFELNPPSLAASSLGEALRGYMVEYARETPVSWAVADRLRAQPTEQHKQILFRIAQEALRNVRKHAGAHRIEILLAPVDNGLLLQVKDDGVGFVPEEAIQARAGHIGMPSMRERLQRAGGWLEVRSAPGAGAVLEAWLPTSPQTDHLMEFVDEPRSIRCGGRLVR
jgi:signal transduction histidine kinase